jgi:putative spermidine/putrescine transport system ATP-binding protein
VTHDQEEALSLADRLVVLQDGEVRQIGTAEEVYSQPNDSYVASFMGYRNMYELDVRGEIGSNVELAGPGMQLTGERREELTGSRAVAAIRPDDLLVGEVGDNRLDVTAEVVEYHGREQAVQGRLSDGSPIHFRSDKRLAPGDRVGLSVPTERVLVFAASGAPAAVEVVR